MVQAIPEGVSSVVPYLCIRGAKKAIEFYKTAFGAEVMSTMPMGDKLIGHADLMIGGARVYLADEMPEWGAVRSPKALKGTSANIHLWVPDCDKTFAQAVSAGAKVLMPLTDQFWGDRYGMVADPFGHVWAITTHKEDLTPEEMVRRAEAAMAKMAALVPPRAAKRKPRPKKASKRRAQQKVPETLAPKAVMTPAEPKPKAAGPAPEEKDVRKKKVKTGKKVKKEKKTKKSKKDKKRKKKSKR